MPVLSLSKRPANKKNNRGHGPLLHGFYGLPQVQALSSLAMMMASAISEIRFPLFIAMLRMRL
jgi:hypothetical protein